MARLDISDPVLKALFSKNNGKCAFDGCGVETVELEGGIPHVSVEIAHICAAEQGGPRYDASQSDDQRRAFDNLVLLCPNHHRKVDKGWPAQFPPDELREMKSRSELVPSNIDLVDDLLREAIATANNVSVGTQSAEANLINNAGGIVNINQGFSAAELERILQSAKMQVVEPYAQRAQAVAKERIEKFDEKVLHEVVRQNLLEAVADPAFYHSLKNAQTAASSTPTDSKVDVLVSLLIERSRSDATDRTRIAVEKAYDVVAKLGRGSIDALTASFLAVTCRIDHGQARDFAQGLARVFDPFSKELPAGNGWLTDLEMLGAIRFGSSGESFKKLFEIWREKMPGLVSPPITASEARLKCADNLFGGLFVETLPGSGFYAPRATREVTMREDLQKLGKTPSEIDEIVGACKFGSRDKDRVTQMEAALSAEATIGEVRDFHDRLRYFTWTPIGSVVVYANLKRKMDPASIGICGLDELLKD